MSESSDSDYDLFKKHGYESDPEISSIINPKSKETDPSVTSLASQEAGPSRPKEDLKETKPPHLSVSFKDAGPSNVGVSFKDDGASIVSVSSKDWGIPHAQDAKRSPSVPRHSSVLFKDIGREASQTSKDDREKDEKKEKSHAREDTVLSMDDSSPDLKDILTQTKTTTRRSSSLTYDAYSKRLDSAYTSELFGSIVHHFRRSITSTEVSVPSKVASISSSITSQISFHGQRKRSSLYSEKERKSSAKKSLRISVFLDTEIGLGKDVTYNDYIGRLWILIISATLWAIALIAYFMRIYGMRNAPVTLIKVPSVPE